MIVLVVVSVVVVIVLVVVNLRLRSESDRLRVLAADNAAARDQARAEFVASATRADAAEQARDAALERAARARRDAAEVARRLQEETAARAEAEARADDARRAADATIAAQQAAAERAASGGGDDAAFLWAVALRQVERQWQVSVATVPGEPSPFDGADDPLRVAAEIVVDAAREEAGVPVDLTWDGGPPVEPPAALVALAVVQEVVAAVAKDAESADVAVHVDDDTVSIELDAVEPETLAVGVAPGLAVGSHRWCVPRG